MENQSDAEEGYVYVLGVKDIDLPVSKIGRTARDPSVRCAEINKSSTGDFLWEVTHQIEVNDCRKLESLVHAKLLPLRQKGREFFNIHPDHAIVAIQSILGSAPDVRVVTITKIQKEDSVASRKSVFHNKQSARPSNLPSHLEKKRVEWVNLIKDEKYDFDKRKTEQKSPSFEYRNWRANIEHGADFDTVILMRLGPECVKPHANWRDISPSDKKQGWSYRRSISIEQFPTFLLELQKCF